MTDTIEKIKQQLCHVPMEPGVYLWKDAQGQVIYVGKAKNLRSRMRQYVNLQDTRDKIPLLVGQIDSFDYIVVQNEEESLILEKNLIQKHKPHFNADFKDDKSYPFIAITDGDMFPAIKYTREKHVDTTRYFGPYTDSRAARNMVDIVRRVVPVCSAGCAEWRRLNRMTKRKDFDYAASANLKACFDCHVGLGPGACCAAISEEEYAENVRRVERFLGGNYSEFLEELGAQMQEAAAELDFERAGRLKQRIDTIMRLTERQNIVSQKAMDADVVGFFQEETIAGAHVLIVREGRVVNDCEFVLDKGFDVPSNELARAFLLRYYDATTSIPRQVILEEAPEDFEVMQEWLTGKLDNAHGAKVKFVVPKRGDKAKLLEMAVRNAKHSLLRYKVRTNYDDKRINMALLQLESALMLEHSPMRIECFDISTIHGSYTVASMVVFTAGRADKDQYRRFKIKTPLDEANDFLSMQEVLRRRYCRTRLEDERFGKKPDLILLDGGKPQLTAALQIFDELGVDLNAEGIAIAGLAKRDEELFVPVGVVGSGGFDGDGVGENAAADERYEQVVLPDGSASLYLVKQVRDEAHRFAITFHRQLRGKGMTKSILDEVEGLGPKRKKALMRKFGSMKRLKDASEAEIIDAHVLPEAVAKELFLVLHQTSGQ